jgi:hypothetical protein
LPFSPATRNTSIPPTAALNYQVEDLDALLEVLRTEGVTIDPKLED